MCAEAPCKSCPYRRDVPSGVWHGHEYNKLPQYDGEIIDQVSNGGTALFFCHQKDGHLCAGWVGARGPRNLVALRLHGAKVDPSVWDYQSPVPLFASGREACDHGKREIEGPRPRARRMIDRLERLSDDRR